jgi:hypothetical protein
MTCCGKWSKKLVFACLDLELSNNISFEMVGLRRAQTELLKSSEKEEEKTKTLVPTWLDCEGFEPNY